MTSTCPRCAHENEAGAKYCSECGTNLATESQTEAIPQVLPAVGRDPESHDPVEPSGSHGGTLVICQGSGRTGERFRILDKMTIGRSPSSDVFLDDVTVSREHAVVYDDGNSVRIEDRASLNGTFVDHQRVEKAKLHHGDEIQVGKYRLEYRED